MTTLRFLSLIILSAICLSCETDFDLEGEWKDVPVVYAFLNTQDDTHYVRVERVFLEPGGDATAIAQQSDSIYYSANAAVVKMEVDGNTFVLERVDGAAEGLPKEEGFFANTPNVLYKVSAATANLQPGDMVSIIVERDGNEPAIAETRILDELQIANTPITGVLTFGDYTRNSRIEWRATGPHASIFDVRLIFHYRETDPNNPSDFINKTAEWSLDAAFERNTNLSLQSVLFRNESFYQFVGSNIDPLSTGIRKFSSINFQVTGTGTEIKDYLTIANANLGITSSQAIPVYTNVENGLGVVTSRYQVVFENLQIGSEARDSLYNGIYTKNLNFVP